jgi:hypothetical protein
MDNLQLFFSFFDSLDKRFELIEYQSDHREEKFCEIHGYTEFTYSSKYKIKCVKCQSRRKSLRKNLHRKLLLEEHGSKCSKCSYNKCESALQFHHIDPSKKEFEISESAYSLENLKAEAKKCILLCANCHAEVEREILRIRLEQFYSKKLHKQFSLS